jgi:hypothetical protein
MTDTDLETETTLILNMARARRSLQAIPGLVAYIRLQITPSLGGAKDGMPRAASKEPPAPARLDAVDDSDAIWRQLVEWVEYWSAVFNVRPPAAALAAWRNTDGDILGFRPHLRPEQAGEITKYLVDWLLVRHDDIARTTSANAYYVDVQDLKAPDYDHETYMSIWSKYPRAPRRPRPVLPRPCPECDHFTLGAEWPDGGQPEDVLLRCDHCGYTDVHPLEVKTRKDARDVVRAIRAEREAWDRPGVLAFYDTNGYWPTEDPEDPNVTPRCPVSRVLQDRLWRCEREQGHPGRHVVHAQNGPDSPEPKPFRWYQVVPKAATS